MKNSYWLKTYCTLGIAMVPSLILFFVENRCTIISLLTTSFVIMALYFLFIFLHTTRFFHGAIAKSVLVNVIYFLIIFYLLLIFWFGVFHYNLFRLNSLAYKTENLTNHPFVDFLYFSVVTVTTLGYGDITPATIVPKIVSIAQVIIGWIYIAFIIAVTISAISRNDSAVKQGKNK